MVRGPAERRVALHVAHGAGEARRLIESSGGLSRGRLVAAADRSTGGQHSIPPIDLCVFQADGGADGPQHQL